MESLNTFIDLCFCLNSLCLSWSSMFHNFLARLNLKGAKGRVYCGATSEKDFNFVVFMSFNWIYLLFHVAKLYYYLGIIS